MWTKAVEWVRAQWAKALKQLLAIAIAIVIGTQLGWRIEPKAATLRHWRSSEQSLGLEERTASMADRERFDRLIGFVLNHEGGYVNDPTDPGGETKYGISKRSYPEVDIKNLTVEQARDIYFADWWLPLRCPEIKDDRVAQKYLDTCVNVGKSPGTKILQKAVTAAGMMVMPDGIIGPRTLAAVNSVDPVALLVQMRYYQAEYYKDLIRRNPTLAKFERGWMRRAQS